MKKDNRKYSDRREYIIQSVAERRRKIRFRAVQYAGGKCMKCGYDKYPEVLEFHHKDPSQKILASAKGGLQEVGKELKMKLKNVTYFVQIATGKFM